MCKIFGFVIISEKELKLLKDESAYDKGYIDGYNKGYEIGREDERLDKTYKEEK